MGRSKALGATRACLVHIGLTALTIPCEVLYVICRE